MAQQENQFFIDSEFLSPQALEKKHRLETDPSSRKSHLEYLPGMEVLQSDVMEKVLSQMDSYDYHPVHRPGRAGGPGARHLLHRGL